MIYSKQQQQEHVKEILHYLYVIALQDARIPIVVPTNQMTAEVALAVRAFQQAYGLPVTGEIDDATWDAIVWAYQRQINPPKPLVLFPNGGFVLQQGDSGELVYIVQVLLNLLAGRYGNLATVTVSGIYEIPTADAIMQLQTISGLPETGKVNQETWDRMASLISQLRLQI